MNPGPTTVVLTGVGLDGGPDIIRGLRADAGLDARIVGVDADPGQPGRLLCDSFHQVPMRNDPGYVDAVADIARSEGASVIYPLPTFDQELFSDRREELTGRGFAVPVSPLQAVRICNHKPSLYEFLARELPGVVPETLSVRSAGDLADAARSLGYPERRVCIRRPVSRGAIGLRILDAGPARSEALLGENPGSLLVSLDEILDVLATTAPFPEYLVQEYLPGEEWDVDALCRSGEAVILATRVNEAMVGGGATRSTLTPDATISSLSREIVGLLGLNAIVNLAFKRDQEGQPKLLEINPRIPLSILAALGGGLNLVALSVRQALGERIEPVEPRWGGRFLRHLHSVVVDSDGSPVLL